MSSGISSYSLTKDVLITAALRKLGVLAEGVSPSTQNLSDASVALNSLIATFKTLGMSLWERKEYAFTPTTGSYTMGNGYTLNTPYAVKLLQAIRTDSSGSKIDMEIEARSSFNVLPNNSTGTPIKVNYQPFINYGIVSFWPIPDSTNTATITLVYQRPFDYMTSTSDSFDFPEEWYLALTYKLAVLLAPEWSIPLQDRQMLMKEADIYLQMALDGGQEDGSLFIMPSRER